MPEIGVRQGWTWVVGLPLALCTVFALFARFYAVQGKTQVC